VVHKTTKVAAKNITTDATFLAQIIVQVDTFLKQLLRPLQLFLARWCDSSSSCPMFPLATFFAYSWRVRLFLPLSW
jgi:hypothetical protein